MKYGGKVIVITGSSSGIGRQAAIDFAKEGAGAIVLAKSEESPLRW